jgi:type VI protein secretion system component Hcp
MSTAIALVAACFLLVTVILPAEYAVDPTGAGEILGLTKMGEIKNQLANEAKQAIPQPVSNASKSAADSIEGNVSLKGIEGSASVNGIEGSASVNGIDGSASVNGIDGSASVNGIDGSASVDGIEGDASVEGIEGDLSVEASAAEVTPSETRSIQLKPGEAAEIKLGMKKGAVITYQWSVDSGHVNYDTHGDGEGINYFGYNKGKATTEDTGELQAAFDGKHGWFWRNRSNQTVTVNLKVSGDYSEIYRVL